MAKNSTKFNLPAEGPVADGSSRGSTTVSEFACLLPADHMLLLQNYFEEHSDCGFDSVVL